MIKRLLPLLMLFAITLTACTEQKRVVTEGRVIYSVEYPNHKDNFFLYSILPKEMTVNFKDGLMESRIEKANLKNILLVDCNQKQVSAYFSYGDEAVKVALGAADIQNMLSDQKAYTVQFTSEKDTIAGFNVKKAIATAVKNPSDKIELWYTDEIRLKHSNWYNPFHKVPGFLLAYAIDRYGIRMEFRAKRFEEMNIAKEELTADKQGKVIRYAEYNRALGDLFKSFE